MNLVVDVTCLLLSSARAQELYPLLASGAAGSGGEVERYSFHISSADPGKRNAHSHRIRGEPVGNFLAHVPGALL